MGLFSKNKPKIKVTSTKKDGFSGWLKCTQCVELIHANELERNNNCCPKCDYHYRISCEERVLQLTDSGTFHELFTHLAPVDALDFVDTERYVTRLAAAQKKSGRDEAVLVGEGVIQGLPCALGVLDFNFMGGSMGSVVGEKICLLIEHAEAKQIPLILVSTSGGARMQESTLSLMQMAKTSAALAKLAEKKVPYVSILTNPTTGGVTASFASLGDVIIAEPNALICFAGPRVIEQILGRPLPPGAQQSEFLLNHGMIDCIVKRHELKETLASILRYLTQAKKTG